MNDEPMRLQRFLARAGVASRRSAEKIIADGRVSVNGKCADIQGIKVTPGIDEVCVDGKAVSIPDEACTLILNKPKGYVSTMSDPHAELTVKTLVPMDRWPSLYPVGRLDADTEGLLLFTTDGNLGHSLLHPSHHVTKTYIAKLEGVPQERALDTLRKGIVLDDGITAPAEVRLISSEKDSSVAEISIHEGRNRQVRRMFKAIGHPVSELRRIRFGPLDLTGVDVGSYRVLSPQETDALRLSERN